MAKCTCAIEAAAIGMSSKLENSASIGLPSSSSMVRRASVPGNGGRWSCSRARSAATLLAQQVGAGRQRLAELDEARAHLLQRRRQALARPPRIAPRGEEPRPGDQRRRDAQGLERKQRVVAREAQRHAQQAPAIAERARACLDPPARMQGDDAERHVAPGDAPNPPRACAAPARAAAGSGGCFHAGSGRTRHRAPPTGRRSGSARSE